MIDHQSPCDVQTTGDCTCTNGVDSERLRAASEAVEALHTPAPPSPSLPWVTCTGCTNGCPYPCPTIAAITAALTPTPGVTGGAGEANGAQVAPVDVETKQDA